MEESIIIESEEDIFVFLGYLQFDNYSLEEYNEILKLEKCQVCYIQRLSKLYFAIIYRLKKAGLLDENFKLTCCNCYNDIMWSDNKNVENKDKI